MGAFVCRADWPVDPPEPAEFLEPVRDTVRDVVKRLYGEDPTRSEFTLQVLADLGEARVRELGGETAKKALGYLVAVELVSQFGKTHVYTERNGRKNHPTRNRSDIAPWVKSYTRHEVR